MDTPRQTNRDATLRDVAEKAGVSISTASRALTGSRPVSDCLTERVTSAASDLGYRANVGARNLRLSRTMTIGLIYEHMDTPVYLDILDGLSTAADARGYSLIVSTSGGDAARRREVLRRLYERRVEALLLVGHHHGRRDLDPFVSAGVPTLALLGRGRDFDDIPLVAVPRRRALARVAERLYALGHRRALYLGMSAHTGNRWSEVEPAFSAAGLEARVRDFPRGLSAEQLCAQFLPVLEAESGATAILAHGRHLGGLYAAIDRRGESIPADRSVVTFSDSRLLLGLTDPTPSAIHVDTAEFGRRAIDILDAWLGGDEPPNVSELDLAEWRETASVGPAPTHRSAVPHHR